MDVLPSSIPKERKIDTSISSHGMNWIYIFCANCGKDGGRVLENDYDFAFYLCEPCAENYGKIAGIYMEPDSIFWQKIVDAQVEKYGRTLTAQETAIELQDETSMISKLKKEIR